MTVGRNDPCPCGSGKKYKKCCLGTQAGTAISFSEAQIAAAENSLLSKLLAFGNSSSLAERQKTAFEEFFAGLEDAPKSFWTQDKEISFMCWFVFDYRLPEGMRVIELFAEEQGSTLTSLEQQLLKDWLPTAAGLYEVQEVAPGRGMLLQDIFTGEQRFIDDVNSSRQVSKWAIIMARVVPVGKLWHFGGYVSSFYPRDKADLIALAKKELRKFKKQHPAAGWRELFLNRVGVFFQYCFEKQINPPDSMADIEKAHEEFRQNSKPELAAGNKVDPEVERQFIAQLMTEYYRRWLDDPVPALGGKTPRQAVKTKTGREKVLQILKEIEFDGETARSSGKPAFDLTEIRQELGLE